MNIVVQYPDFWVVNKPAGMSFHREGEALGLLDEVRAITGEETLFPVHRLDRLTSGLVLVARSAKSAAELGKLFATGGVEKYYLALSNRTPTKKQGLVQGRMIKGRSGAWRLGPVSPETPSASTQFFSYGLGKMLGGDAVSGNAAQTIRLFLVRPRTGRTHQIRVALKSLGSPILGDERYGSCGVPVDRGYLHAYALRFSWRGEVVSFVQPPVTGTYFTSAVTVEKLQGIGNPWELAWPSFSPPSPTPLDFLPSGSLEKMP